MPHKGLIKHPHVTEKATLLKNENKYVFDVVRNANKSEIKKTLEKTHKINVVSVRTVRIGKTKKAIVALKAGQTINEKV
ncbi:MAG: 50S ribosomal protein L23 [Parcubacteria group bacterium]